MRKILINASNLHHGGGVQVAASFITELAAMLDTEFQRDKVVVYVSTAVDSALKAQGFDASQIPEYVIFDVFGIRAFLPKVSKLFVGYDLVFTVFGPLYLSRKVPNHVVGFAQLWILCPENEISMAAGRYVRMRTSLLYKIKWLFFKYLSSRLVVELPHVKSKLVTRKGYPDGRIDVAFNCVSALYFNRNLWAPVDIPPRNTNRVIRIGYPARAYPHKNLKIILDVAQILKKLADINFQFYVTLHDSEWAEFSSEYRAVVNNIGELTPAQCPTFYEGMDGVLFVSLLECFSATPLEAMVMRRPLFASDREFVRDCCDAHAVYVDPLNPQVIAKAIFDWFFVISEDARQRRIDDAYVYLNSLPGSRDRAANYINIMQNQLNDGTPK